MSEELQEQVRTALRESWISLVIILVATGLQYWVAILLARWLSPADYGDFEVAMTLSALLWLVALQGSEKSIFKFLPVYMDRGEWGHYRGFVRFHAALAGALSLGIAVIATLLALADGPILTRPGREVSDYHPLLFALWLLPLSALANFIDKMPRLFHQMSLSLVPIKILLPLLTLGFLYGFHLYGYTVTDWLAVGAVGLASVVVLVVQLLIVRRLPTGRGPIAFEPRRWVTSSVPIMITGFLILAMVQVDLLMVEWLGAEGDVGVFGLAARTAMVVFVITHAVNAVMAPSISRAVASDDRDQRQTVLKLAASLVFWPAGAVVVCLILFGGRLLEFIGPDYVNARYAMLILAFGHVLEGTIGFTKQFILYSDHKRIVVIWLGAAVVFNAILNAILIPIAGVTGAAIATSSAMVTSAVGTAYVTWRRYRILPIPGVSADVGLTLSAPVRGTSRPTRQPGSLGRALLFQLLESTAENVFPAGGAASTAFCMCSRAASRLPALSCAVALK